MTTPRRPGAPREPDLSGAFRIDRDGAWRHEGIEVTHPGVLRNLYANLRTDREGYFLQAGPLRVPVEVVDTPFVVVRVEPGATPEVVEAHLSDGTDERLDAGTLVLDARGVPYCRVKGGRFPARLSVAAWLQLASGIEPGPPGGDPVLILAGRRISLGRRE
jgi:hypothetical protein